ncbi:hypothetical protein SH1V18_30480 [Vallitalea longa]|uniref:Uncharacterized protein n=1 Tax=Vallitalea longa TaxID=2936439 RepID=A0A9W5YG46_9FIRM|nr:hypothetical protein [Vallitalea longa]GKX30568.1 hypothetical protein SH1V18_30480 [Vallitalea longa]
MYNVSSPYFVTVIIQLISVILTIGLMVLSIFVMVLMIKALKRGIKALDIYIDKNKNINISCNDDSTYDNMLKNNKNDIF